MWRQGLQIHSSSPQPGRTCDYKCGPLLESLNREKSLGRVTCCWLSVFKNLYTSDLTCVVICGCVSGTELERCSSC